MDSSNQIPSFEIPKSAEQAPIYKGAEEKDPGLAFEGSREILPAPATHGSQGTQLVTDDSAQQLTPLPAAPTSAVGSNIVTAQNDAHLVADDTDVIEKEWVDRAKKIISLTSNDPFVEAKELSKLKATYMKKRFNKEIPLADEKMK